MQIDQLYTLYKKHPKICTDTRNIIPGSLFFALKGDNFNANEFAETAILEGCEFAVIDEKKYKKDDRFILVDDVLSCLQELARYHRSKLEIPFLGITGSNGKTTTKEIINAVLSTKFNTWATRGNLNNHIGVPLTLLEITDQTEIAIIEMGANHIGEIAFLSAMAKPTHGIITNIGKAHLEGFGSVEGVKIAKKELYDHIESTNGILFVNHDNDLLMSISNKTKRITYGKNSEADINGKVLSRSPFLTLEWKKNHSHQFHPVNTQLVGEYNFENVLGAICIGNFFNVDSASINRAIENYAPNNNRSQLIKSDENTILMDAYNANPVSMELAVKNLAHSNASHKVAILGDMRELGNYSREEHVKIVQILQQLSVDKAILVGPEFSKLDLPVNFTAFSDSNEAKNYLKNHPIKNALVLVKGSRGIQLEKLLDLL